MCLRKVNQPIEIEKISCRSCKLKVRKGMIFNCWRCLCPFFLQYFSTLERPSFDPRYLLSLLLKVRIQFTHQTTGLIHSLLFARQLHFRNSPLISKRINHDEGTQRSWINVEKRCTLKSDGPKSFNKRSRQMRAERGHLSPENLGTLYLLALWPASVKAKRKTSDLFWCLPLYKELQSTYASWCGIWKRLSSRSFPTRGMVKLLCLPPMVWLSMWSLLLTAL